MFGVFGAKERDADFWTWFAANAPRIKAGGKNAIAALAADITAHFEKSYPDLVWEIAPGKGDLWVFCASADGNEAHFDRVRAAVMEAPSIPGWEIKVFRQRGSLNAVINMNGLKLGYDDLWCRVTPEGSRARVMSTFAG